MKPQAVSSTPPWRTSAFAVRVGLWSLMASDANAAVFPKPAKQPLEAALDTLGASRYYRLQFQIRTYSQVVIGFASKR